MILAAADYADDPEHNPPPPELSLAFSCERWRCLPYGGGLQDQPAGLMNRMSNSRNVYDVFTARKHADNWAELAKQNPQWLKTIQEVERLRAEYSRIETDMRR